MLCMKCPKGVMRSKPFPFSGIRYIIYSVKFLCVLCLCVYVHVCMHAHTYTEDKPSYSLGAVYLVLEAESLIFFEFTMYAILHDQQTSAIYLSLPLQEGHYKYWPLSLHISSILPVSSVS